MPRLLSSIFLLCFIFGLLTGCSPELPFKEQQVQTSNTTLKSVEDKLPVIESPEAMLARGIESESSSLIEEALQKGAQINDIYERQLPLTKAAYLGSITIIDLLLEHGAELDGQNVDKNTALMVSIIRRNNTLTNHLLERGSQVNVVNFLGDTPLHFAVQIGDVKLCKELCKKGANPGALNHFDESPKSAAKRFSEKPEFANPAIIAINALFDDDSEKSMNALLWEGIISNDTSTLQTALDGGADINALNAKELPITYAIRRDKNLATSMLLASPQLHIDTQNDLHETALMMAIAKRNSLIVAEILDRGANVELEDRAGFTALHYAIDAADLGLVKILLGHNANPFHKCRAGNRHPSPSSLAARKVKIPEVSDEKNPEYNSEKSIALRAIYDLLPKTPPLASP